MKFSMKTFADRAPEVTIGGMSISADRLAGVEFKAGNGALPHVVLTLIPAEVDLEIAKAAVTQVEVAAKDANLQALSGTLPCR